MAIQPVDNGATEQTPITTKPPAQPVAANPAGPQTPVTPTPSAQSPLPITTQQPVTPQSATDPMAFSGGSSMPGGTPLNSIPNPAPGAVPSSADAVSTFSASTPMSGLTEAQKNAYWAAQGVQIAPSATGATQTGVGANGVNTYDPASVAAGQQSAVDASKSDPAVASLLQQLGAGTQNAGALNTVNSAIGANNAQTAAADTAANQASMKAAGYLSPSDIAGQNASGIQYSAFGGSPATAIGNDPAGSPGGATPLRSIQPSGQASDIGGMAPPAATMSLSSAAPVVGGPSVGGAPAANPSIPGATSGTGGAGVNLTPTTADNALTNQTISAGPMADRFKIASDQYNAAKAASEPGYLADLREANRGAFGAGRGVSGMLRTTRGNIESDRQNTLAKQQSDLLNGALTGSIDDAYKNLGIAQQQQGFQNQQQQQAFGNQVTADQLLEYLTNGAFNRGQAQQQAGYANDPSNVALILSSIFGNQATGAGQAAGQLFGQAGQASTGGNLSPEILKYLQSLGVNVGGSSTPTAAPVDMTPGVG
jgi:hypothetical protein